MVFEAGNPSARRGAETVPLADARHSRSSSLLPEWIIPEIPSTEFHKFQELIYGEAGIWLSPDKAALLSGRLTRRMRHLGVGSFRAYYDRVSHSTEERDQMLDAIATNETRFFREPGHFRLLAKYIFPGWTREAATEGHPRTIRVLSVGCSTGDEPYSLAMVLLDHFPPETGWGIEIVAADLSTKALTIAKRGIWPADVAREIPRSYLRRFMLKGVGDQAGKIRSGTQIRSVVQFVRCNLNRTPYPFTGKFDLIFCRNVLIYFDVHSARQSVQHLSTFLSQDGYLFVGHAENLRPMGDVLTSWAPTVYRLAGKGRLVVSRRVTCIE